MSASTKSSVIMRSGPAELRAMGHRLLAMADEIQGVENPRDKRSTHLLSSQELASEAARLYAARRIRSNYFDELLFGEPAWDIMLDLFLAAVEDRDLRSTSVCIASAVPLTTALRWIKVLQEHGLIERRDGVEDKRCSHLRLSEKGYSAMVKTLSRVLSQRRNSMADRSAFSFSNENWE